ncbi:hypothetical protein DB41_CJ00050 [Neochlamydia sp. TUME1]|nr:hypothetical protein DB41_CJ00050 [Neochlamydia sp. TUME1]
MIFFQATLREILSIAAFYFILRKPTKQEEVSRLFKPFAQL